MEANRLCWKKTLSKCLRGLVSSKSRQGIYMIWGSSACLTQYGLREWDLQSHHHDSKDQQTMGWSAASLVFVRDSWYINTPSVSSLRSTSKRLQHKEDTCFSLCWRLSTTHTISCNRYQKGAEANIWSQLVIREPKTYVVSYYRGEMRVRYISCALKPFAPDLITY
jgi:hypothetical protein